MTRLLIHVEGATEETFVNLVLAPHLYRCGYSQVGARLLGNARPRDRRGGARDWPAARRDIVNHLRGDSGCVVTTMVDFYGLPQSGGGAWPGRAAAATRPFPTKAKTLEDALRADICKQMCSRFDPRRFVPYVSMHEFEALLFSDCQAFARGIDRPDLAPRFAAIRSAFGGPEEIDDSPATAPSKRIADIVDGYQKPLHGSFAAAEIGLDKMRAQCPNFGRWLRCLEAYPP